MTVRDLKSTWENLGRTDPLWAVLSDPARRHGRWGLDEFMATGEEQVAMITTTLERHGLSLGRRVLDFGCGVGRLSNALAGHADQVVGVDIAASMVEQARELNRHRGRLEFVSYDGRLLPFPDDSFDSAVSFIVLQHARPPVQLACLLELLRVVRPGGLLLVQIPSAPRRAEPLAPEALRARIEVLDAVTELPANESATVRVRVHNVSEHTWPTDRLVKLGNHWRRGGAVVVGDDGRADLPEPVEPGASAELELLVTAPSSPGPAELELDVVQEFVTWFAEWGSPTARVDMLITEAATESAGAAEPTPDPRSTEPGQVAEPGRAATQAETAEPGRAQETGRAEQPGRAREPGAVPGPGCAQEAGGAEQPGRAQEPGGVPESGRVAEAESARETGGVAELGRGAEVVAEIAAEGGAGIGSGGTMEMHGLHTDLVRSVFAHCGAEVVEATPDTMAGAEWDSFTYLVRLES